MNLSMNKSCIKLIKMKRYMTSSNTLARLCNSNNLAFDISLCIVTSLCCAHSVIAGAVHCLDRDLNTYTQIIKQTIKY